MKIETRRELVGKVVNFARYSAHVYRLDAPPSKRRGLLISFMRPAVLDRMVIGQLSREGNLYRFLPLQFL